MNESPVNIYEQRTCISSRRLSQHLDASTITELRLALHNLEGEVTQLLAEVAKVRDKIRTIVATGAPVTDEEKRIAGIICDIVSKETMIHTPDLIKGDRKRETAIARYYACALIMEFTTMSLASCATYFFAAHNSTIRYRIDRLKDLTETDPAIKNEYIRIREKVIERLNPCQKNS